jgi:hypothetical protein
VRWLKLLLVRYYVCGEPLGKSRLRGVCMLSMLDYHPSHTCAVNVACSCSISFLLHGTA